MEVIAKAMQVRVSPRKMRLVVDLVRGKDVNEALGILKFTANKSAVDVYRAIRSAQANAENNFDLDPDDLYVKRIFVDDGQTFKRWRPRARGRVNQRLKRTSHLTVVVAKRES